MVHSCLREVFTIPHFHRHHHRPNRKSAMKSTRTMKGVKKAAGITEAAHPSHAPRIAKRQTARWAEKYRGLMQVLRLLGRLR